MLAFVALEGAGGLRAADVFVLVAVALCAVGYAEGGALAREIGGWRVICWALLFAAPAVAPVVLLGSGVSEGLSGGAGAWLGFCYVWVVSMFLGFFAWYGGLAAGGVARISQLQLAQPVLTIVWSAVLLGEEISGYTLVAALLVLSSVAASQRARVRGGPVSQGAR